MPNLAGVYAYDERAAAELPQLLARMAQVVDIPSVGYSSHTAIGGRAGCVNLLRAIGPRSRQPARDPAEGLWLMLDGELYNAPELKQQLQRRGIDSANLDDADLCLALYRLEGETFVEHLNGQFNVAVYRDADQSLLLANDRFGYRPLFTAEAGSRFLFASEMKAILAVLPSRPRIDGIGLLQILRDGTAIGDRTWIEEIRVLGPGTTLHLRPGGMRRERYFRLRYRDGGNGLRADAFVEGFAERLRVAARRIMKGDRPIGISLSGGLDSRTVILGVPRERLPIPAYTFGDSGSRDVVYASELARLLCLPHFHLRFDPGYLSRVMYPVVWRNEGLFPFVSSTSIYFHSLIRRHMDVILNGHCGDALTGSHIRPEMMIARSRPKMIESLFRQRQVVPEGALAAVLKPSFYRQYSPLLLDAMRSTFDEIDNEKLPNVADAWDMENRQRRGTFHSPSVDRYRFEQRTPFLDTDLVDHLTSAPPRWRFQQRAYKRMIIRAFPRAAHVPWAYTGRPLAASASADYAVIGWSYLSRRAGSLVAGARHRRRPEVTDFRDLASELRADRLIADAILDFTEAPWFPDQVFDRDGVRDVVFRHFEQQQDCTRLVGALATFAAAFRLFLSDPPVCIPSEADPVLAVEDGEIGTEVPVRRGISP